MQFKQPPLAPLIIVTCTLLLLTAVTQSQAVDKKADLTGTWSWPAAGKSGTITAKLKLEGEKVTGTVTFPGRDGHPGNSLTIEDGKLKGNEVSFSVSRELAGKKLIFHHSGKVSSETIKGKIETEFGKQIESREWDAKRQAEKK